MIVIRDSKTVCSNFYWPKNVDEKLNHKIEFIIKSNESLAENKTKMRLNNYCPNIRLMKIQEVLKK